MASILEVEGISKAFAKKSILENIVLQAAEGECLCLIGKNGSGKSTLINMIIDVVKPDSGYIDIFGGSISDETIHIKKNIGVLPEFNPLIEEFSVQDYLEYVGLIYKLDKELIKTRSAFLIEYFFEDPPSAKKSIGQFSKGMKLKVGICAALIHKPKLLILDEPFDGMDMFSSQNLVDFLNDYRNKGNLVFVSSHDMLFMEKIATKVAIIREKRLLNFTLEQIEESGKDFESFVSKQLGYNPKEIKDFA
tara:strand:+ start:14223 stop:14969 length:747 start_codon:yes stop_codon:yes gene_type:complete